MSWFSRVPAGDRTPLTEAWNVGATNAEIATELSRILAQSPSPENVVPFVDSLADDLAHDAYFRVDRIVGENVAVFARMTLFARIILLREVDESAVHHSRPFLGEIDRALADLMACLCGAVLDAANNSVAWETRGVRTAVMPRWVRGHQIFAALTQGLIVAFKSMGRAIRVGDSREVRRWADLCISLLRGSGAAFVLTGDFSVDDYIKEVRPSMMPPASPICLSGLMSVDHRFLVQTIRDMKPALNALHEQEKTRHERIHEELKTVYDRHIFVCERFVGKKPSLLTAGNTEKSGPELIEQFKTLRLKVFESSPHALRLKAPSNGHSQNHQLSSEPMTRLQDAEPKPNQSEL